MQGNFWTGIFHSVTPVHGQDKQYPAGCPCLSRPVWGEEMTAFFRQPHRFASPFGHGGGSNGNRIRDADPDNDPGVRFPDTTPAGIRGAGWLQHEIRCYPQRQMPHTQRILHRFRQEPQLLLSIRNAVFCMHVPLHRVVPCGHGVTHWPAVQICVLAHCLPHSPQLPGSLMTSTQPRLQVLSP